MEGAPHRPARLPLKAAMDQITPPRQAALVPLWLPAIAHDLNLEADSRRTVSASWVIRWNDLAQLADGFLTPARLGGEENRERRENVFAAARTLASPACVELRNALAAVFARQAQAIKQHLSPDKTGVHTNREAKLDPDVNGYVFLLRQMYRNSLEKHARQLLRRFPRADEADVDEAVTAGFTAAILNPKTDFARLDKGLGTVVQWRLFDQYRASTRKRRMIYLNQPEGERLAAVLSTSQEDPAEVTAGNEAAHALKQIVPRLPEQSKDTLTALIDSDGEIGPTELARLRDVPRGTASSRIFKARASFESMASADPKTKDTMQAFARRRGRHKDTERDDPRAK